MMKTVVRAAFFLFCFHICFSQQTTSQTTAANDVQAVIAQQFGSQFVLAPGFPVLTGDFNGDGSEDAVFVVTSPHGGVQTGTDQFRVIDPSSEYFGLGDVRITSQFVPGTPAPQRYLLIIHGNGKDGWHAKEPKDKFVLINLAFDRLSVGHVQKKKKVFDDISVEETGILNSFLFWNGKRYKWQPGAADL